jgi:solute carrier family 25 carnitine/acylcarnitine transporter 20/29
MKEGMSFQNEAVAGCAAGIVGTLLGYPLDVIKTRMQTSQRALSATVYAIAHENGPKGFYIGLASPLLALTILNTMNFTAYNFMCETFQVRGDRSEDGRFLRSSNSLLQGNYALAGAAVGPLAALISTPFELVKTQVQLQKKLQPINSSLSPSSSATRGSLQIFLEIMRQHGPVALLRGHVVNTIREIVFLSTYFMIYEHGKEQLQSLHIFDSSSSAPQGLRQSSEIAVPIAGGIAGAVGWAVSFPLDNIKSHIQSSSLSDKSPSILSVGKAVWQQKGLRGLYAGVVPSITRSFIVSATRFTIYERVVRLLRDQEQRDE